MRNVHVGLLLTLVFVCSARWSIAQDSKLIEGQSKAFHEFNATFGPEGCPFNRYPGKLIIPAEEPDFWTPEFPKQKWSPFARSLYLLLIVGGVISIFISLLIMQLQRLIKKWAEEENNEHSITANLSNRKGLSLIELVVVISILSILMGLLMPAIQSAREAARRTQCQNNLRQISLAMQNYLATYKVFPAAAYKDGNKPKTSWVVGLLPYLELDSLSKNYDLNFSYDDTRNERIVINRISILQCPTEPNGNNFGGYKFPSGVMAATASYHPIKKIHPLLTEWLNDHKKLDRRKYEVLMQETDNGRYLARSAAEVLDGLSHTFIFSEVCGLPHRTHFAHFHPGIEIQGGSPFDVSSAWTFHGVSLMGTSPGALWAITNGAGGEEDFDGEPYSYHGGIVYFARADGGVQGLTVDADITLPIKLFGINDGETL